VDTPHEDFSIMGADRDPVFAGRDLADQRKIVWHISCVVRSLNPALHLSIIKQSYDGANTR
jgi:hypothetical protein